MKTEKKKGKKANGQAKEGEEALTESLALYRWTDAQGRKVICSLSLTCYQLIEFDITELQGPGEYVVRAAAAEGEERDRLMESLLNHPYKVSFPLI